MHGITSYAQNFEDIMLWRALKQVEKGFYIDVGAQHPVVESVSLAFYERGWRGIHVEPIAEYAALLRAHRPDETVVQAAVSDRAEMLKFYEIPETGLSTAALEIAERHRAAGYLVREILVPALPLGEIFPLAEGKEIHWLKIDVEGWEKSVLESWGQDPARPWIVVVECTFPNTQQEHWSEWEDLVLARGYRFVYFDGLNRFYVHERHQELISAFRIPPNIFDVTEGGIALSEHVPFCYRIRTRIDRLAGQAEEARQQVVELQSELAQVKAAAEARQRHLTAALAEAEKQTAALQAELTAARARTEQLAAELALQQADNQSLAAELTAARAKIEELNSHAHHWYLTAQEREKQLVAVYASWSWKITAPLRLGYRLGVRFLRQIKKIFAPCRKLLLRPLLFAMRQVLRDPILADRINRKILRYPLLHRPLHALAIRHGLQIRPFDPIHSFTIIRYNDIDIYFSNGPLVDQRGIGRVSREILKHLQQIGEEKKFPVFDGRKRVHFYSSIHWCPDTLPSPSVVMIHDVIPLLLPEMFPEIVVLEWKSRYRHIAHQASHIIAISHSSAKDIARYLELPVEKISVIYNGVSIFPVARMSKLRLPEPYVVFLGTNDHHKNLDVIFQALTFPKANDIQLVLIGDNESCSQRVKELKLERRVHYFGKLSDDEAGYVIKHAVALVFPSLYEGFGLPPLEAALLGVPSICSKRPAMTEILKDATIFVDPNAPEEWAEAMFVLLRNLNLREQYGQKAEQKAKIYTWHKATEKLIECLCDHAI